MEAINNIKRLIKIRVENITACEINYLNVKDNVIVVGIDYTYLATPVHVAMQSIIDYVKHHGYFNNCDIKMKYEDIGNNDYKCKIIGVIK